MGKELSGDDLKDFTDQLNSDIQGQVAKKIPKVTAEELRIMVDVDNPMTLAVTILENTLGRDPEPDEIENWLT